MTINFKKLMWTHEEYVLWKYRMLYAIHAVPAMGNVTAVHKLYGHVQPITEGSGFKDPNMPQCCYTHIS